MRSVKARCGLAALAGLSTASLYAEGVLVNGWIEVLLLAPVVWFLLTARGNRLLEHTLLIVTAVCLTVTVSDLALRPVLGPTLQSPMNLFTHRLPELPLLGRWDPNVQFTGPTYGDLAAMTGDPSLRDMHEITFITDSAGFRNRTVPDPVHFLLLGDSFGAGGGVTQDKVVSEVLQARTGLATYNLSFPACGPWQQYLNFAIESPRLVFAPGARLMWLLYTGNDLDDEYGETWRLEELPWRSGFNAWRVRYKTFRGRSPLHQLFDHLTWRLKRQHSMAENVVRRALPDGGPMLFLKVQEEWPRRPAAEVRQHPNFPKFVRTLDALKQLADRSGVGLSIVVLPTKGEVYPWILNPGTPPDHPVRGSGFAEAVLLLCDRAGVPCFDAKPVLHDAARRLWAAEGELLWWRDDTHLNEHGHAILAEFLTREVLGKEPRLSQRFERTGHCMNEPC